MKALLSQSLATGRPEMLGWVSTSSVTGSLPRPMPAVPTAAAPATEATPTAGTSSLASRPRSRAMLIDAAATRIARLVSDKEIEFDSRQIASVRRLLLDLVTDGGPLPQVAPTISGGIEVQWLVGAEFVGLIVDPNGEWLLWNETSTGAEFEVEGSLGEPVPPNRCVELRNQLAMMGGSARFWAGPTR